MVAPGLRALLDEGDGAGVFEGADARIGAAEHAVCGDRVQLSVRLAPGTVRAVRWRAAGCPASMAVAALAARVLVEVPIEQAAATLGRAVAAAGGLAAHERHAEALVLRALRAAIDG